MNKQSQGQTEVNLTNHDQNHSQWITQAVDEYEQRLMIYATRLLTNTDLARDAVQETFFELCRHRKSALEHKLTEWLFTVCRNKSLDLLRKAKHMNAYQLQHENSPGVTRETQSDPAKIAEQADDATKALALIQSLPDKQHEAVLLKFQQGLTYKQISTVMNESLTNVGYLIHQGLKTVRQQMTPTPNNRNNNQGGLR